MMTPHFPWFCNSVCISLYLQRCSWRESCTNPECLLRCLLTYSQLRNVFWRLSRNVSCFFQFLIPHTPSPPHQPGRRISLPSLKSLMGGEGQQSVRGQEVRLKVLNFWLCRIWVISQRSLVSIALWGRTPRSCNSCCPSVCTSVWHVLVRAVLSGQHCGPQSPSCMRRTKSGKGRGLEAPLIPPRGQREVTSPDFVSSLPPETYTFSVYLTLLCREFIIHAFSEIHNWIFILINPRCYKWLIVLR